MLVSDLIPVSCAVFLISRPGRSIVSAIQGWLGYVHHMSRFIQRDTWGDSVVSAWQVRQKKELCQRMLQLSQRCHQVAMLAPKRPQQSFNPMPESMPRLGVEDDWAGHTPQETVNKSKTTCHNNGQQKTQSADSIWESTSACSRRGRGPL